MAMIQILYGGLAYKAWVLAFSVVSFIICGITLLCLIWTKRLSLVEKAPVISLVACQSIASVVVFFFVIFHETKVVCQVSSFIMIVSIMWHFACLLHILISSRGSVFMPAIEENAVKCTTIQLIFSISFPADIAICFASTRHSDFRGSNSRWLNCSDFIASTTFLSFITSMTMALVFFYLFNLSYFFQRLRGGTEFFCKRSIGFEFASFPLIYTAAVAHVLSLKSIGKDIHSVELFTLSRLFFTLFGMVIIPFTVSACVMVKACLSRTSKKERTAVFVCDMAYEPSSVGRTDDQRVIERCRLVSFEDVRSIASITKFEPVSHHLSIIGKKKSPRFCTSSLRLPQSKNDRKFKSLEKIGRKISASRVRLTNAKRARETKCKPPFFRSHENLITPHSVINHVTHDFSAYYSRNIKFHTNQVVFRPESNAQSLQSIANLATFMPPAQGDQDPTTREAFSGRQSRH